MNRPKTISLFLAVILVAGTITAIIPSFIGGIDAQALPDYRLDNYNSKSLPYKKDDIQCNNVNLNFNGGFNFTETPESLRGLVEAQTHTGDSEIDTGVYGAEENRFGSYDSNKKDFLYKCINNNDNEFIVSPTPSTPPPTPVDNVCTVWQDSVTPGNFDIFFARSTDGGLTFTAPENISETTGNSRSAQISVEGNNVYVVWLDETPGNNEIFFARSTDGGLTFSEPENISENTRSSGSP